MPTESLLLYRVWCVTEAAWVRTNYILESNGPPTTCPHNTAHTIDPALTTIISTVPPDGSYDADGNLMTVPEPRGGEEKYFYVPNLCDPCCWYENATPVIDEALATADNQIFDSAHPRWIDLTHGRVFKEDSIPNRATYTPVITVNAAAQVENPWGTTDEDYTVNYEDGKVTFNTPLTPGDVVVASYSYGNDSTFTIEAEAGKRLKVLYTEVQFLKNIEMTANIIFGIYVYNPADPATQATGTTTVAALLATGNTLTIAGLALIGVNGARTPGSNDFDSSLGTTDALAGEIAAALTDPLNQFATTVSAIAAGSDVDLTADPTNYIGPYGNAITLASDTGNLTVSGAALTGGVMNPRVLYKSEVYKRLIDFFQESTGPYPVTPSFGGSPGNERGISSDVITLPFQYQAYRDLKSSQGTQLRVSIDGNVPMIGDFANATFYCLSELET